MVKLIHQVGVFGRNISKDTIWRHVQVLHATMQARSRYQCARSTLPVTLYTAEYTADAGPAAEWVTLLGEDLRVVQVGGTHHSIMEMPHSKTLAAAISATLSQASSNSVANDARLSGRSRVGEIHLQ